MILVIDGYNVLKRLVNHEQVSEAERDQFIKHVGRYAKKKGHKAILVFDGGPDERTSKDYLHGVHVVYAGLHEIADVYIKRYIEKNQMYDLLLVSSDRDICAWADRHAVESLDSQEFCRVLADVLSVASVDASRSRGVIVKTVAVDTPELDALMQSQVGVVGYKKESVSVTRKSSGQQSSKKDKKLIKKIKKL